jgi:hypothetical protein
MQRHLTTRTHLLQVVMVLLSATATPQIVVLAIAPRIMVPILQEATSTTTITATRIEPRTLISAKYVELPHVVVMKFVGNKIAHEHIYWDQGSLLVQIGLLNTDNLPVKGIEQSRKLRELVAES